MKGLAETARLIHGTITIQICREIGRNRFILHCPQLLFSKPLIIFKKAYDRICRCGVDDLALT